MEQSVPLDMVGGGSRDGGGKSFHLGPLPGPEGTPARGGCCRVSHSFSSSCNYYLCPPPSPHRPSPYSIPPRRLWQLNLPEWPLGILGVMASMIAGATSPAFSFLFASMIAVFYTTNVQQLK